MQYVVFQNDQGRWVSFLTLYQPEVIEVDGQRYWGDGLSWAKAEVIAKRAIVEWTDGTEDDDAAE